MLDGKNEIRGRKFKYFSLHAVRVIRNELETKIGLVQFLVSVKNRLALFSQVTRPYYKPKKHD